MVSTQTLSPLLWTSSLRSARARKSADGNQRAASAVPFETDMSSARMLLCRQFFPEPSIAPLDDIMKEGQARPFFFPVRCACRRGELLRER